MIFPSFLSVKWLGMEIEASASCNRAGGTASTLVLPKAGKWAFRQIAPLTRTLPPRRSLTLSHPSGSRHAHRFFRPSRFAASHDDAGRNSTIADGGAASHDGAGAGPSGVIRLAQPKSGSAPQPVGLSRVRPQLPGWRRGTWLRNPPR